MITVESSEVGDVRAVAAEFFDRHRVTLDDDDAPRYERQVWTRACADLGVSSILESEEHGGLGGGAAMLAAVLVEAGRTLSPLPLLSSAVSAQTAVRLMAAPANRANLLEELMAGSRTATLAPWETSINTVSASRDADGVWTLDGAASRVLDGTGADVALVIARVDDDLGLFLVEDGFTRRPQTTVDVTRQFATLTFDGTSATLLGATDRSVLDDLRHWITLAVVADQVGGSQACLDMTVEYLKTRVQFGRVLGSFQSLKHQCADLALQVDEARSALAHLVWALDESPADTAEAAAMAIVVGSTTHVTCAEEAVHLHGGIGFTWEHDAHRHVRRALANRSAFVPLRQAREVVLAARGI